MTTRKQSEAERKQWTFGQLLAWHMDHGTRPACVPTKAGRRWTGIALAQDCGLKSDLAVRPWRSDEYAPDDIETLERVLFGDQQLYEAWKNGLREAWSTSPAEVLASLQVRGVRTHHERDKTARQDESAATEDRHWGRP